MNRDAQILRAAQSCSFGARYLQLCFSYAGVDEALRLKKGDVNSIILKLFEGVVYDSKAKIYFVDQVVKCCQVRLCIPYKDGFIGPWYVFQNPQEDYRYRGSFNLIAQSEEELIRDFLPAKFPCVRTPQEIESVFGELSSLHNDFIKQLENS